MAKQKNNSETEPVNSFRFSLGGLILFSLCLFLLAGTALCVGRFLIGSPKPFSFASNDIPDPDVQDKDLFTHKGPWGELLMQNIKLERPMEYIPEEDINPAPEAWNFNGLNLTQVKELLVANGLTSDQVAVQTTASHVRSSATNTVLTPDEDFLLALKPEVRQKLYAGLYGLGLGLWFDYPYIFPEDAIATIYANARLHPDDIALLKQLVYPAPNAVRLTDYNLLMRKIPTVERRKLMAKAISLQPAVLARLCIRPDSDIDKIVNYWSRIENVRFTDTRPMLEALKGLSHGGTVSLTYFFPPFARSRLYTFPLPPQPGDPVMDCHWSTFNFSRSEPDNHFNDPAYLAAYLKQNFYRIEVPANYGDIVMFADEREDIKHSAVFLADDLFFTKYGYDYHQPWMIVRMADMQAIYPALKPAYFRRKTD